MNALRISFLFVCAYFYFLPWMNAQTDNDGDGFPASQDCNDNNASIFPGAPEILCNGIDDNCDGIGNDDRNNDGDPVSFCNGDCDDNNPNRYPGNIEIRCNSFDENCTGNGDDDVNQDGDPVSLM